MRRKISSRSGLNVLICLENELSPRQLLRGNLWECLQKSTDKNVTKTVLKEAWWNRKGDAPFCHRERSTDETGKHRTDVYVEIHCGNRRREQRQICEDQSQIKIEQKTHNNTLLPNTPLPKPPKLLKPWVLQPSLHHVTAMSITSSNAPPFSLCTILVKEN